MPGCASGTASGNPSPWRGFHRSGSVFPDTMHLTALDFLVLAGYFAGLIAIGLHFTRRQTSQASYFLGDRKMPWFLVGISVVATLVSTNTYLATPGEMIKNGIGFFSLNLAYVFVIPAVTLIIIPVLMRLPVTSVYEYLDKRFN